MVRVSGGLVVMICGECSGECSGARELSLYVETSDE